MIRSAKHIGWGWVYRISLTLVLLFGLTVVGLAHWLMVDLPSPDTLYKRTNTPSTRIYDRNGRLLYEILDPHGGSHTPVALDEVPQACVDATVATEDASFYQNPGVDGLAIVRALWINLWGREILSGGSTITQQLARNLLLLPEERTQVSLERKMREAILAWRLARIYSKDEILTLYLNESYYGNLAYGIEAASRSYFAKRVGDLDLAECALLAGLPQSPARYNPLENPDAARARQQVVLGLMVKNGYITPQESNLAAGEQLGFASAPFPIEAPHFVMYVRGQLEREFGLEAIYTQGLRVYTTLDLDAQKTARRAIGYRLEQLTDTRASQPSRNVHNAAVIAMDPVNGHVLAMVGSPDYFDPSIDGAVNATVATRQPGSSIKPITYAAALDPSRPNPLTPATMVVDVRTAFVTREGDPYVPQNYDHKWRGPVLLRQALASSLNLVAVKVLDYVGIDNTTALARSLGITTFDDADRFGLALTLGGGEVRLLELTAAYAAFANRGHQVQPVTITRIEDSHGNVLKAQSSGLGQQVMDERVAYLITDILSDNLARAGAFGEGSPLNLSRPAAAKTGTTTDWRDNWTIGYTPELAVGVWAGNADNEPMRHVSGIAGAAPIWHDVVNDLLKGQPVRHFQEPPGLVHVEVCADSGMLPSDFTATDMAVLRQQVRCPRTMEEMFIDGTQPTRNDDWHWAYKIDQRNGLLAGPGCPAQVTTWRRYTLYPAEAQAWVRQQDIDQAPLLYSPLCPNQDVGAMPQVSAKSRQQEFRFEETSADGLLPTETASQNHSSLLIMTGPDQGSRYRLSAEMPGDLQQIEVMARPIDGVTLDNVTLMVDNRPMITLSKPPFRTLWPMELGAHVFSAVGTDVQGMQLQGNRVTIEVLE